MSPSPPPLVDTHCHIMDQQFAPDLPQVLQRAWDCGLRALVCVGYDLESSIKAVELAETDERIFATVGIHPNSAAAAGEKDLPRIEDLLAHPRVVGVGETGLDLYRTFTEPALQREFFQAHLAMAARHSLPVVVHNREASRLVSETLLSWTRAAQGRRGVLHCFSGDLDMLRAFEEAGWYISFAGPLTFKNAGSLPVAARETRSSSLVVETDAPYLAPAPLRGRRNEPAFLVHTVRKLAAIRGETERAVAETTYGNALALFPGLRVGAS